MRTYTHTIIVSGSGHFPIDMLRKDGVHPLTEEDSHTIRCAMIGRVEPRSVTLTREAFRDWTPTYGRWESFGWHVIDHQDDGGLTSLNKRARSSHARPKS